MKAAACALVVFDCGPESDPCDRSDKAKSAEHEERRRKANPLRDPAAERRAECCTCTLDRDHCAMCKMDAAGSVKRARDHAGHRDALQANANAVQDLDGDNAPPTRQEAGE